MDITLTPQQYESLLKLAYLGHWMANGVKTESEREEKYEEIMQTLYAKAEGASCGNFVEYDKKEKKFLATKALDEVVTAIREEYDNEIFWDELIEKLALRDLLSMQEGKHWYGGDTQEIANIRSGIIKKYVDEFEQNSVNNLVLKTEDTKGV